MKTGTASERGLEVLRTALDLTKRHGIAPSVRELTDAMGFKSVNATADHLDRLERTGLICWRTIGTTRIARGLMVTQLGLRALERSGGTP